MRIYQCGNCHHPVYFNNVVCEKCRSWLGYLHESDRMVALAPGGTTWSGLSPEADSLQYCANHQYEVCNWLVTKDAPEGLCIACDLNNVIPNLNEPDHLDEWRRLEVAKHRLVYALRRLNLPLANRMAGERTPLEFDFLSEGDDGKRVFTGHDSGRITINTAEADSVHRESTRIQMHERYRTLIGHFRHEVGHYYWDVLIAEYPTILAAFRGLFGDEREDYQEALKRNYKNGPPADWRNNYISKYAATHAWEDWAETWAHYLHLLDMLETAHSFGMSIAPILGPDLMMNARADFDPYQEPDMERILAACIPLIFAVNTLNRGMGRKDIYPFVINAVVRRKLTFVHEVVRGYSG